VKLGVPFYRTKEIKELANDREITTKLFISDFRFKKIKERFGAPKPGDILLTAIGTIGEVYVVKIDDEFYFKDGNVLWLKEFTKIDPYFLKYVLLSFVKSLNELAHGAAYNALPIQRLNEHNIFVPSPREQIAIVTKLDSIRSETHRLESIYQRKLTALDELKKSLLHQAFNGEL
jgi:type I restriction enzyme S subunit